MQVSRHVVLSVLFFFFSSRRRHTRFDCDWSSDVCSSDLVEQMRALAPLQRRAEQVVSGDGVPQRGEPERDSRALPVQVRADHRYERSEEHTSELQSQSNLVCRLLLEKKKHIIMLSTTPSAYTVKTRLTHLLTSDV